MILTVIWRLVKRSMAVPRCGHWQRNDDALTDSLVTTHRLNSQLCDGSVGFNCSRAQCGSSSTSLTTVLMGTLKSIVTLVSLEVRTNKGEDNCRMLLKPPSLFWAKYGIDKHQNWSTLKRRYVKKIIYPGRKDKSSDLYLSSVILKLHKINTIIWIISRICT